MIKKTESTLTKTNKPTDISADKGNSQFQKIKDLFFK